MARSSLPFRYCTRPEIPRGFHIAQKCAEHIGFNTPICERLYGLAEGVFTFICQIRQKFGGQFLKLWRTLRSR